MNASASTPALKRPRRRGGPRPQPNPGHPVENSTLTELRNRLLAEASPATAQGHLGRLLRLAAVEAEAEAWQAGFPLLLFPTLFEEKTLEVQRYLARQQGLWHTPHG